jgi:hypothetical protein
MIKGCNNSYCICARKRLHCWHNDLQDLSWEDLLAKKIEAPFKLGCQDSQNISSGDFEADAISLSLRFTMSPLSP